MSPIRSVLLSKRSTMLGECLVLWLMGVFLFLPFLFLMRGNYFRICMFYLLVCVFKGVLKVGMRVFLLPVYPIEMNNTTMSSFLFNCIILIISSYTVVHFSTIAFSSFVNDTAVSGIFLLILFIIHSDFWLVNIQSPWSEILFPLYALRAIRNASPRSHWSRHPPQEGTACNRNWQKVFCLFICLPFSFFQSRFAEEKMIFVHIKLSNTVIIIFFNDENLLGSRNSTYSQK